MTNTNAIATKLNVLESAIVRVEEWASVLFVVVKGLGARFVSKKVVEVKVNKVVKKPVEITMYEVKINGKRFAEALKWIKSSGDSKYSPSTKTWMVNGRIFDADLMTEVESTSSVSNENSLEYDMYNPNGRYYG